MRGLVETSVRRRITVLMAALAAVAFGIVGYQRLAVDLFPDITYPSLTVQTEFPDAAPQEVESLVTRPVEEAVGVLRGLRSIHSVSRSGVSEVTLEFDWDSDMDVLSMDVRDQLDRLILPDEAEDPIVLRFDPALDPIIRLAVSGSDGLDRIRTITDKKVKQDLETVKGIAAARLRGGLEEEIRIDIDQERLAARGITLDQVRRVVQAGNLNTPGGALRGEDNQFLIRTLNEFDSIEEIQGLIVRHDDAGPVLLSDVAQVYRGVKERDEITRAGGRECVQVDVYKEGDANTVAVAKAAAARLALIEDKLPEDYEVTVLFNQARFIEQSITEVRNAALIGGLLAIFVLWLFLRDLRSTWIIATAIPVSVIVTFILMYRMGISLNVMSLGGLTLGIGMLVDNAIVVLESIHRKREAGMALIQAAVEGTTEVGAAVMASTLTTVAVFLPIIFVEGIAGQLFKDQAITVTASLLASLVVALTLIPMLSAWRRSGREHKVKQGRGAHIPGVTSFYESMLKGALARPVLPLALAAVIVGATVLIGTRLGSELIPQMSQGQFFFEVKMPEGTSLNATDRVMTGLEKVAADNDAVERYSATIGSRLVAGGMSLNTKAENLGQLDVVLKNKQDAALEDAVLEELRAQYSNIPDVQVRSGRPSIFSLKTPVEAVIYGEDLDALRDYSLRLADRMATLPGFVDVRSSLEAGNPEIQVVFDRDRLSSLGLDLGFMSETLKNRVLGVVPTRFKEADRQIDVRIRNQEDDRHSLEDVENLVLPGPDGRPIRLMAVADIYPAVGPAEVHRILQQRAAVVTANLSGRNLGAAVKDLEHLLAVEPVPRGMTVEIGGQNKEMQVSFASLKFGLALAVFLVYLVMAATFESLLHPFIVLFTVPLALVGVVMGLGITGTPISVIVLIGAVMLVGIVVNNAIVLIDTINRYRRDGLDKKEAVIQGCLVRLRPILMTTLTTVLGILPMALSWGEGSELRAPLGITVAFGLSLSMLLTLVIIPTVYVVVPSRVQSPEALPEPEGAAS